MAAPPSTADALAEALGACADDFSDAIDRCAEVDGHANEAVEYWYGRLKEFREVEAAYDATRASSAENRERDS